MQGRKPEQEEYSIKAILLCILGIAVLILINGFINAYFPE